MLYVDEQLIYMIFSIMIKYSNRYPHINLQYHTYYKDE